MLTNCLKTYKLASPIEYSCPFEVFFFIEMEYSYKALYPCIHHTAHLFSKSSVFKTERVKFRSIRDCKDLPDAIICSEKQNKTIYNFF